MLELQQLCASATAAHAAVRQARLLVAFKQHVATTGSLHQVSLAYLMWTIFTKGALFNALVRSKYVRDTRLIQ